VSEFLISPSNRMAWAAAQAVIAARLDLLLLSGPPGVGKTRLLQEICAGAHGSILLAGDALHGAAPEDAPVVCFDDIWTARTHTAQLLLVRVLDRLHARGARAVLTIDRRIDEVRRSLSQALYHRLSAGMHVQIEPPDRELRVRLIRQRAGAAGVTVTDEAVDQLADEARGSIRDVIGAVTRCTAIAERHRQAIDAAVVDRAVPPARLTRRRPIALRIILDVVCAEVGIEPHELLGRSRHARIMEARGLYAYCSREWTDHSYPEIARSIGRLYHSTIHAAERRARAGLRTDPSLCRRVESIEHRLRVAARTQHRRFA
jgi:chromosomal replication initiator protein